MKSPVQAVVYEGVPGAVQLRDLEIPSLQDGEILLELEACTICPSDLHSIYGRRASVTPFIPGHEFVGRILQFGENAPRTALCGTAVDVGSRVICAIAASCGTCFYCTNDLPQKCATGRKYGHDHCGAVPPLSGGFCSHCVLLRGTTFVAVPQGLPVDVACLAGCAASTAVAILDDLPLKNQVVLVLGGGTLGLMVSAFAISLGASHLICCERDPGRTAFAKRFGINDCIHPDALTDSVMRATEGRGADFCMECTGSTPAVELALQSVRIGGTVLLAGSVMPGKPLGLQPEQIVRRMMTIRGVHNYAPRHLLEAVRLLHTCHSRFAFGEMAGRWFALSDAAAALDLAESRRHLRVGFYCSDSGRSMFAERS